MAIKVYIQKRPSIVVQVGAKVINTGGGGVDSVNGQTGVVVLDASDLNAYPDNNPAGYVNAYGAAAAAPVQSVNGNTGAVVLTATDVGAPSGSGTSTGSNTGDQDLSGLQLKSIVVAGNITAVNDGNYTNVASATYTDPSPVEGKGFRVMVRNGTATVGGTAYSTPGTVILRIFHSGSWANYVYQVAGGGSAPEILYCDMTPITLVGITAETLIYSFPVPTNIGNGMLRVTYLTQIDTFISVAGIARVRIGTIPTPNLSQMLVATQLAVNGVAGATSTNIFRNWPIIGGASGSIRAALVGSNVISEQSTAGRYTTFAQDFTNQKYIYFTMTPYTSGHVMTCNGIIIEFIKEKL